MFLLGDIFAYLTTLFSIFILENNTILLSLGLYRGHGNPSIAVTYSIQRAYTPFVNV